MKGIWEKYIFQSQIIHLTLNDPACDDYEQNNTHIWVTVYFNQCRPNIQEINNFLVQENTAKITIGNNTKDEVISRVVTNYYNMRCIFDRSLNVSTSNSFRMRDTDGNTFNSTAVTTFNASMAIYVSSSFSIPVESPYTVTHFQPIYVGIKGIHNNENFKFIVNQCFASPSANRGVGISHIFFDSKCSADNTFKILGSGDNYFNFKIDTFTFIQIRKSIFIHCNIFVCKRSTRSPPCTQVCENRRRRAILQESAVEELPVEELSLTSGEIVYEKKSVCEEVSCQADSFCINLYPAECRCNDGLVLQRKTGLCIRERIFNIIGLHADIDYVDTYSDPTSIDFLSFARDLENELTVLFRKDDETIEGVKVLRARKGSVVVDLSIIYGKTTTKEKAFGSFVKTLMSVNNSVSSEPKMRYLLKIKKEILPTIEIHVSDDNNLMILITILLAAFLVVIAGIILMVRCKQSRKNAKNHGIKGFENNGIVMEERWQ